MKDCRTCGQSLPLTDYYRHPTTADGLFSSCKRCTCKRQLAKRKPETVDDRHRLSRGRPQDARPYILGVWTFTGSGQCMAVCRAVATVAMLVKELGELPYPIRLCAEHHTKAVAGCSSEGSQ